VLSPQESICGSVPRLLQSSDHHLQRSPFIMGQQTPNIFAHGDFGLHLRHYTNKLVKQSSSSISEAFLISGIAEGLARKTAFYEVDLVLEFIKIHRMYVTFQDVSLWTVTPKRRGSPLIDLIDAEMLESGVLQAKRRPAPSSEQI